MFFIFAVPISTNKHTFLATIQFYIYPFAFRINGTKCSMPYVLKIMVKGKKKKVCGIKCYCLNSKLCRTNVVINS